MASYSVPQYQWIYQNTPASGGLLYVYQSGTTTPQTIYSDGGLTTPASNPFTLDSNGEAKFYVDGTQALRFDAFTSTSVLIQSIDPVYPVANMAGFTGTGADLQKIAGITNGTASANKALVVDGTLNVSGLITNPGNTASTGIANMLAVQNSLAGGFTNVFRNARMDIAQRGQSGSVTTGSANYTLDGWIVGATGATATWAQATFTTSGYPGYYSMQIVGNSSMTDTFFRQRIEASWMTGLVGQSTTVQFIVYNNTGATITPTITVKHPTVLDNYGSTVTDINAVNLQPITNASFGTLAYTFFPASFLGMEITVDFGAVLNANTKYILFAAADCRRTLGVSAGLNSTPPVLETRPVPVELLLNQPYYETSFGNLIAPAQNVGVTDAISMYSQASTTFGGTIYYKVPKRAVPSITTYNPSAANANWRDVTNTADRVVTVGTVGKNGFVISGASGAVGANNQIHFSASAEL